jgi:hypothetical protein
VWTRRVSLALLELVTLCMRVCAFFTKEPRGVAVGQVDGKVCDRMCQGSVCEVERASM